MVSDRDRITGDLRGLVVGSAEGTITGGRFTFDPDQIKQVIDNWKDLAESYEESINAADPMVRVAPPGDEFVSESFADKANTSGLSYLKYCQHNRDVCRQEAQRYQDALDTYLGVEERTVIDFGVAGDDIPPAV